LEFWKAPFKFAQSGETKLIISYLFTCEESSRNIPTLIFLVLKIFKNIASKVKQKKIGEIYSERKNVMIIFERYFPSLIWLTAFNANKMTT
jgi:hypothetical protein